MSVSVKCETVQIDAAIVSVRSGICTDQEGNRYADFGIGVGAGVGIAYLNDAPTHWQTRDAVEFDAHADMIGLVGGQISLTGGRFGYGALVGAFPIGFQGLNPLGKRTPSKK